MKDGFVSTKNHGRIHYLEAGSGKPIILLQSNGNSAYEYDAVLPILGKSRHVIAWDQPGQGDSDRIVRHYSVEDYGDAVIEFMDALGLKTASVLGSSIGGSITVDLGARHAKRIDRLFIVEAPVRTTAEWAARWQDTDQNWSFPTQTREQVAPRLRHLTDPVLQRWNIDRNKAGSWTMVDVMWAIRLFDVNTAVKKVWTKHTMAIYGKKGQLAATAAPVMEKNIPGCKLTLLEHSGHFPMLDEPEELSRIVDGFMGD